MDNYKNKIIQLLNSNAVVNDELYQELYYDLIKNIKTNNIILENSIIGNYDEIQIFYISHSGIFIMCYHEENNFTILNEDELMCDISKNIDTNIFSIEKKHSIIKNIINKKKKEKITDFIPESSTIQLVLDILNTILYNNKDLCKLVLILIGELIENKVYNNTIYFVNIDFKKLLTYIFDYGYSYFKTDLINVENFKTKHYNYDLNKSVIIPCNKFKIFYCDLIKNNIIQIILVSLYYKNRYKSSKEFIETNTDLKNIVCYFNNKTINDIVEDFDNKFLEKSTCLKITHSELHYLWKEYCFNKNIPNVVSFNQLKEYYNNEYMLYKTSSKLEYVSEFINFWKDNIYEDEDETNFEISELQYLLKHKKNITLNEKKIINLISHLYSVDIENDKYINKINCNCFCKKNIISKFKTSDYYNSNFTKNILYKKYIDWVNKETVSTLNNVDIVISKNYFIKHI